MASSEKNRQTRALLRSPAAHRDDLIQVPSKIADRRVYLSERDLHIYKFNLRGNG